MGQMAQCLLTVASLLLAALVFVALACELLDRRSVASAQITARSWLLYLFLTYHRYKHLFVVYGCFACI